MLELIEKTLHDGAVDDTITLPYALRQRSRQRVRLDSGREAALMLPPSTQLADGDRLRAVDGTAVRVSAAVEDVSTARTDDPLRLARACYHLGNRHVALQIGAGFVRYQPDHVLDDMVRGLGLTVTREATPFEPERGAYQSQPHGHGHAHGHSHPHDDGHHH
jgi:urease accessory protein